MTKDRTDCLVKLELDGRGAVRAVYFRSSERVDEQGVTALASRTEEALQSTSELICRRQMQKPIFGLTKHLSSAQTRSVVTRHRTYIESSADPLCRWHTFAFLWRQYLVQNGACAWVSHVAVRRHGVEKDR